MTVGEPPDMVAPMPPQRDPEALVDAALAALGVNLDAVDLGGKRIRLAGLVDGSAGRGAQKCDVCGNRIPRAVQQAVDACPFCLTPFYDQPGDPAPAEEQDMSKARAVPAAAVVPAGETMAAITDFTRADLEDRTRRILDLKDAYATRSWDLARALAEVRDKGMWQVAHKSWSAYVDAEIRITSAWADTLIAASEMVRAQSDGLPLKPEEVWCKVGKANAARLLREDPQVQRRYVRKLVDAPRTKRELDEEIAKDPDRPRPPSGGAGRKGNRAQKAEAGAQGGRPRTRVLLSDLVDRPITVKVGKDGKGDHAVEGGYVLCVAARKGAVVVTFKARPAK